MSSARSSEDRAVQQTLLSSYCPPLIRQARERQDALLLELVTGGPFAIADVGCGDAYHAGLLRDACATYHGFEIAPSIAEIARDRLRREGMPDATIMVGDAREVPLAPASYDLVLCLYFTPGNFRTELSGLDEYTDAYLDRNPGFIAVVTRFLAGLVPAGRMFLTVYQDVPEAEAAQVDYYHHTGQEVVTPAGSRFVATAQKFWSARWTRRSMLSNLAACGVDEGQVAFHELNSIAWLVEVTKP